MNLSPDQLSEEGYVLAEELNHKELVPFVRRYLNQRSFSSIVYYLLNGALIGLVGFMLLQGFQRSDYSFGSRFTLLSYGFAVAFLLIPLHEYIHVLAYRSQGASNTSYDVNLKKFYFMALADRFVADRKEFRIVAMAPFVLISSLLTLSYLFVPTQWHLSITGALLAHTAMCSGDFGLMSFFEIHKDKQPVTYDDVRSGKSYFYIKPEGDN